MYGVRQGKYDLVCGSLDIQVRIDGQSFKRVSEAKARWKQHYFDSPYFNQSEFATVKGQKMNFQYGRSLGKESSVQIKCREKGFTNCGTYSGLADPFYGKRASRTTDGFTASLIEDFYATIDLTNKAVLGTMVGVLAVGTAAVVGAVGAAVGIAAKKAIANKKAGKSKSNVVKTSGDVLVKS